MTDDIEALSRRRQELWATGENPAEVASITKKLEALYEDRRITEAQSTAGRSRKEIVKQARIESELERLSSR